MKRLSCPAPAVEGHSCLTDLRYILDPARKLHQVRLHLRQAGRLEGEERADLLRVEVGLVETVQALVEEEALHQGKDLEVAQL